MKTKFLSFMVFAVLALSVFAGALAIAKNIPAEQASASASSVDNFQTANTMTATANDFTVGDFMTVKSDRQTNRAFFSSMTDSQPDAISNVADSQLPGISRGDVSIWDYQRRDRRKNLYEFTPETTNFRPPNENSSQKNTYQKSKILKFSFDAVSNTKQRK